MPDKKSLCSMTFDFDLKRVLSFALAVDKRLEAVWLDTLSDELVFTQDAKMIFTQSALNIFYDSKKASEGLKITSWADDHRTKPERLLKCIDNFS